MLMSHAKSAKLDDLVRLTEEILPVVKGRTKTWHTLLVLFGKLICISQTFMSMPKTGNSVPEHPIVFMKATSAINGRLMTWSCHVGRSFTDWEIELGVVIGETAKCGRQRRFLLWLLCGQ